MVSYAQKRWKSSAMDVVGAEGNADLPYRNAGIISLK